MITDLDKKRKALRLEIKELKRRKGALSDVIKGKQDQLDRLLILTDGQMDIYDIDGV